MSDSGKGPSPACVIDKKCRCAHVARPLRYIFHLLLLGAFPTTAVVCSSCSGTGGVDPANTTSTVKTRNRDKQVIALGEAEGFSALEERFAFDSRSLKKDKEGKFIGPVRSQYEGKRDISFGGGLGKAVYRAGNYQSPEWKGHRQARTRSYPGKTDGSRFQTPSRVQVTSPSHLARKSRFHGRRAGTGVYKAGGARESNAGPVDKPSDGYTDFRRRVFPEPLIISDDEYNRRSVEQMRNVLGRDD